MKILFPLLLTLSLTIQANDFSYDSIAKRNKSAALNATELAEAKMQGECLVGLKKLNFKVAGKFDPIAEWTNYRSISLLEQLPPCEVLVIMEVARAELSKEVNK